MDCTHAEMLLVEHVTGEIPEATRVALEDHLARCEACRALEASLRLGAKYAAALPIEEAPALDMKALRAAMRARAVAADPVGPSNASAAAPAPEPTGSQNIRALVTADANPRPGYGETFRRWVTGPQVAMATLTCLVVAIGLTYVPLSQKGMPADGDTVAAPADSPAAAAPRMVVAEQAEGSPGRMPTPAPPSNTEARVAAAEPAAMDELRLAESFDGTPEVATNAMPAPAVAAIVPPAPVPAGRSDDEIDLPADTRADARFAATGYAGQRGQTGDTPATEAQQQAPALAMAPAAQATTTATPSAPPATVAPATRGVDPGAVLAQARSLRSSGACGAATNVYQRFLSEAGTSHPQRGPAMMELADCLQRTGRTGVARQTLEQAQGVPSVSAQARRELEQASPERAAPTRSARPAASPRQSDTLMDNAYRSE